MIVMLHDTEKLISIVALLLVLSSPLVTAKALSKVSYLVDNEEGTVTALKINENFFQNGYQIVDIVSIEDDHQPTPAVEEPPSPTSPLLFDINNLEKLRESSDPKSSNNDPLENSSSESVMLNIYSDGNEINVDGWDCKLLPGESDINDEDCTTMKDAFIDSVARPSKKLFKNMVVGVVGGKDSSTAATFMIGNVQDSIVDAINAGIQEGEVTFDTPPIQNVTVGLVFIVNFAEPKDDDDADCESGGEGGSLRQVEDEDRPKWTRAEIGDMKRWCGVCVKLSQGFHTENQKSDFLINCAKTLKTRSFDPAVCDELMPEGEVPIY